MEHFRRCLSTLTILAKLTISHVSISYAESFEDRTTCSHCSRINEFSCCESIGLDLSFIMSDFPLTAGIVPAQHLPSQPGNSPGRQEATIPRLHRNMGSTGQDVVEVERPLVADRINGLDFKILWRSFDRLGKLRAICEQVEELADE